MEITVKGKNFNVGDSLREHVEKNLDADVKKYFDRALHATVIFSKEAYLFRSDVSVHAGRGMVMQGKAAADEVHAAFDGALERAGDPRRPRHRHAARLRQHRGDEDLRDLPAHASADPRGGQ